MTDCPIGESLSLRRWRDHAPANAFFPFPRPRPRLLPALPRLAPSATRAWTWSLVAAPSSPEPPSTDASLCGLALPELLDLSSDVPSQRRKQSVSENQCKNVNQTSSHCLLCICLASSFIAATPPNQIGRTFQRCTRSGSSPVTAEIQRPRDASAFPPRRQKTNAVGPPRARGAVLQTRRQRCPSHLDA